MEAQPEAVADIVAETSLWRCLLVGVVTLLLHLAFHQNIIHPTTDKAIIHDQNFVFGS